MRVEEDKGVLGRIGLGRMTAAEYNANLSGLNMFFGAVLGLALTGAEKLNSVQFGVVLCFMIGIVVSIQYITSARSARHRLGYAAFALVNALIFPEFMDWAFHSHEVIPHHVRPTLVVWTLITTAVEFWARHKEEPATP